MHNFFYVIKQLKNQSTPQRQVIATTLFVFVFDIWEGERVSERSTVCIILNVDQRMRFKTIFLISIG